MSGTSWVLILFTVSKAMSEKCLKDGVENRYMGFSEHIGTILN